MSRGQTGEDAQVSHTHTRALACLGPTGRGAGLVLGAHVVRAPGKLLRGRVRPPVPAAYPIAPHEGSFRPAAPAPRNQRARRVHAPRRVGVHTRRHASLSWACGSTLRRGTLGPHPERTLHQERRKKDRNNRGGVVRPSVRHGRAAGSPAVMSRHLAGVLFRRSATDGSSLCLCSLFVMRLAPPSAARKASRLSLAELTRLVRSSSYLGKRLRISILDTVCCDRVPSVARARQSAAEHARARQSTAVPQRQSALGNA